MAKSDTDLINPYLPDIDEVIGDRNIKGSVFIGNSTYSGADIQILVNCYDGSRISKDYISQLEEELSKAEKNIDREKGNIDKYMKIVEEAKPGTPEVSVAARRILQSQSNIQRYQDYITSTKDRLKTLGKKGIQPVSKVLAEAQTISISTFRDKREVRALGSIYSKGVCRGPRTVAGSLVFTVFNEHVLYEFMDAHASDFDAIAFAPAMLDQIPPVDILITFANEYGYVSRMLIHAVEFVSEGQVMSIEDLLTENTVNYIARDIEPMRSVSKKAIDENGRLMAKAQPLRASDLIMEDNFQQYKEQMDPFTRFTNRRNPFV